VVVDVFDVAAAGVGRCADGGGGRVGEGQEVAVAQDAGNADGSVNVVADACSDAADVPCFPQALLEDGGVDWRQ
jgi:hypothetical protein